MNIKLKRTPKLPLNAVYLHPTDGWCVRKSHHEVPLYSLWFAEGMTWRDSEHGNFASCNAAVAFAEAL
jgi:hypothetical protein